MLHDHLKMQRRFNIIWWAVAVFIAIVFLLVISLWIFGGILIINTADKIEAEGLKAVLERLWCGPGSC